jgi:hypothetical protein
MEILPDKLPFLFIPPSSPSFSKQFTLSLSLPLIPLLSTTFFPIMTDTSHLPDSNTCNDHYIHVIHYRINTRPCCHDPISCNHVTLPVQIPEPVQSLTCAQSRSTVLHSCGALRQTHVLTYVHSLPHGNMITPLFPCTSPLQFLCSMHPPYFMLPSVCLMLTFPIAPQLAPIVLRVPTCCSI